MEDKYHWENDTWADIVHENGEVFDANLWTCDSSGRQYISFYKSFNNKDGLRVTDGSKAIATFRVIQEQD